MASVFGDGYEGVGAGVGVDSQTRHTVEATDVFHCLFQH